MYSKDYMREEGGGVGGRRSDPGVVEERDAAGAAAHYDN